MLVPEAIVQEGGCNILARAGIIDRGCAIVAPRSQVIVHICGRNGVHIFCIQTSTAQQN